MKLPNSKCSKQINPGFTLIEVTISMVIFLVMLSGVLMIYEQSLRSFRQNDIRSEVIDNLRISLDRMTRELMTCKELQSAQNGTLKFITTNENGQDVVIEYYLSAITNEITNESTQQLVRKVTGGGTVVANPVSLFIKQMQIERIDDKIDYANAPGGTWYAPRVRITLTGGSKFLKSDIVMSAEVSIPSLRDVRY